MSEGDLFSSKMYLGCNIPRNIQGSFSLEVLFMNQRKYKDLTYLRPKFVCFNAIHGPLLDQYRFANIGPIMAQSWPIDGLPILDRCLTDEQNEHGPILFANIGPILLTILGQ